MKPIQLKHILVGGLLLGALSLTTTSCKKETEIPDVDYSRYSKTLSSAETPTDVWVRDNLQTPYNIEVIWRYNDVETDMGYNVIPPMEDNVQPFLEVFRDVFIKSYIDIYKGSDAYKHPEDFIRTYVPKQIELLGGYEYQGNGNIRLGLAEGGRKIVLSGINYWRDPEILERFMRTIFHEFSHILHQTKLYDITFEQITKEGYTAQWFNPTDNAWLRIRQSREQGFVSDYARKNRDEDFVETIAYYLILSPEGWDRMISSIDGGVKYDETYKATKDAGLSPDEQKEALAAAADLEVSEQEIFEAYKSAIMAILDKAAVDGKLKLTRELRRAFEQAINNGKIPDDLWDILYPFLAGKTLDDIWSESIGTARETKALTIALESKADRQARAAAIATMAEAKEKIGKKLTFVSNYFRENWSIDIQELRSIVQANYLSALSTLTNRSSRELSSFSDTRVIEEGLTGDVDVIHTYSCPQHKEDSDRMH